jgi:serine/threonine protein kinase
MLQSLDILETIHNSFVLHRDIKPQNFMIREGELFLIDFGLATFYIDENGEDIPNTCSQTTVIGTPKYLSINIHNGNDFSVHDDFISPR